MNEQFEIWLEAYIEEKTSVRPERLLNGYYSQRDLLEEAFNAGWEYRRLLEK